MKRFEINGWCEHLGTVSIRACDESANPHIGAKLITMRKDAGALSFHFGMSPDQARSMADALLACCEELERVPA